MAVRTSAKYAFGLEFTRFMPLNDDLTIPTVDRMIGGVGPFDFSGVAIDTAVPLKIKIDNATVVSATVDVSGASDTSAVTATELAGFLDTAFSAASADLDASVDSTTSRIKVENTNTAAVPDYIQLYGECAEIALFGQGFGLKFVKTDTLTSIGDTPTQKDEETFTTTDANGLDTEVLSDGYRKGFTASIVDTAEDWELLALIEGGTYDETAETYEVPTSDTEKLYFFVEAFYGRYARGTNKEADLVDYVLKLYRTCKGTSGEKTHERGFADGNYAISGTSYKDENGDIHGDTKMTRLTISEYESMDVYNV